MSRILPAVLAALLTSACTNIELPDQPRKPDNFKPPERIEKFSYADPAVLADFEADAEPVYRLGEGDQITLQVWNRPELSGKQTVGPDGQITLPLLGVLRLSGMTRDEATQVIRTRYLRYYSNPILSLSIDAYQANRITVIGKVQSPGVQQYDRPPLLLEALARAGSQPVLQNQASLTRAAVFRGRDRIVWVDLRRLLDRGELAYNIRLKPNDLVYLPDAADTMVYVLGAVSRPGALPLSRDMTILAALGQAGGPTQDANQEQIALYRPGVEASEKVTLRNLMLSENSHFTLKDGDVVYVPKRGLAEVGYAMQQLMPGLSYISFVRSLSPSK